MITETITIYRAVNVNENTVVQFNSIEEFSAAMQDINEYAKNWQFTGVYNKDIVKFQVVTAERYFDKSARFVSVPHPVHGHGDWRVNRESEQVVNSVERVCKVSKKVASWK
jgi:hypothetical protein